MLARLDRRQREGHVCAGRREDENRIDIGFLQHIVIVAVLFARAEDTGASLGPHRVEIADGRDFDAFSMVMR